MKEGGRPLHGQQFLLFMCEVLVDILDGVIRHALYYLLVAFALIFRKRVGFFQ